MTYMKKWCGRFDTRDKRAMADMKTSYMVLLCFEYLQNMSYVAMEALLKIQARLLLPFAAEK